jgi:hypothetical protein
MYHVAITHFLPVYLAHLLPAVLKEAAFVVKTYVQERSTPSQAVREIKSRGTPFIELLPAMRAYCLFLIHDLFHLSSPYLLKGREFDCRISFSNYNPFIGY